MSKIAVASTDGQSINEHFGSADWFFIYEVSDDGAYELIERRTAAETGGQTVEHAAAVLRAELLEDVEAVLVVRIGRNAETILQRNGIKAFAIGGSIDKALSSYGKKSRLVRNLSVGCSRCGPAEGNCSGGCR